MASQNRILVLLFLCFIALTKLMPAQQDLQAKVIAVYKQYCNAAKAGNFEAVVAVKSAEVKKEIQQRLKTKKDKTLFLEWERLQIPESYEVQHLEYDSIKYEVNLYLLSLYEGNEKFGTERGKKEMLLTFKNEANTWKLHESLSLGDPDKIIRPKDLTYDTLQIDEEQEGEVGGRIIKTEFCKEYTLVVLRVMDEENAIFLPSKDELAKERFNFHELDPWNLYAFTGHPHKTDKLKFFATSGHPVAK